MNRELLRTIAGTSVVGLAIGNLLSGGSVFAASKEPIRPGIRNTTGFTIAKGIGKSPGNEAHRCTGVLRGKDEALARIGLNAGDLKAGVPCIAGDFDGDKFLDITFFPKADVEHLGKYAIFFFGAQGVRQVISFEDPDISYLIPYHQPGKPGRYGEPASPNDGWVQPGEGGTTRVFLYDRSSGRFKRYEVRSEED